MSSLKISGSEKIGYHTGRVATLCRPLGANLPAAVHFSFIFLDQLPPQIGHVLGETRELVPQPLLRSLVDQQWYTSILLDGGPVHSIHCSLIGAVQCCAKQLS